MVQATKLSKLKVVVPQSLKNRLFLESKWKPEKDDGVKYEHDFEDYEHENRVQEYRNKDMELDFNGLDY